MTFSQQIRVAVAKQRKKQPKETDRKETDPGTPETRKKLRPDPVQELYRIWLKRGYRDAAELYESALEIRQIFMLVSGGLFARAIDWTGTIKGSKTPLPEWLSQRRTDVYVPWTKEMTDRQMTTIMQWLIDEKPLGEIDRYYKQKNGRASHTVVCALTRYAYMSGRIRPLNTIS